MDGFVPGTSGYIPAQSLSQAQCSAGQTLQQIGSQVALQRVATAQTALQDYLQLGLLDKPPAQVPSVFVQVPNNMLLMEPLVQNTANSTVFFAGVTPTVAVETLLNVFARFGRVMDLNLFRPYKGCRTSKGCGLVVFSQHSEAAAALQALNGRFVWPGARSPMVIEWCDPSKQHKNKPPQQAPAFAQPVFQQQALPHLLPGASNGLNLVPQGLMAHMMLPHSC